LCQCAKLSDNGIRYLGISSNSHTQNTNKNDYVNSRSKDSQFRQKSVSKFRIKYLSLAKCPQITDNSLIYLSKAGFFSQIKYLNLRGCTQITDKFIKYFTGGGSKPPMKQRFENHNNNDNDDSTLSSEKQLIEIHNHEDNIPFQLKSLDLAKCRITDKALEYLCRMFALVQSSDSLQRLSLRYCENISDDGIKLLALNCKNLQHLNVTKCNRITANALKQIKSNCKSCIIQHTNFSFC
jgi:F-box and leucine-rich repeat protein 7